MNVDYEMASWSNLLIYSAMAVYAIAFLVYAWDLFGGRRLDPEQAAAAREAAGAKVARRSAGGSVAVLEKDGADDSATSDVLADDGRPQDASGTWGAGAKAAADARGRKAGTDRSVGSSVDAAGKAGSGAGGTGASGAGDRWARVATGLLVIAVLLHAGAVATRTLAVMRVPWGNMMEYALTASAIVGLLYVVSLRFKDLRYLGTFVSGGLLVTLGLCITVYYTEAAELIPALQSYWLVIHVPIAILSTALLSISAALALVQIARAGRENGAASGRGSGAGRGPGLGPRWLSFLDRLPASEDIERVSYRLAAVGFITWTFTLIAGAVWAEVAWGRYWGWDTKEIWTFVVWVVYAAYLHARATRGWGPTRVAVLNLIGLATVLFNFTVVNVYFNGLHSYSGI
ncbi:c-type cytochrome biogenesis protein CcsB [Brevibacterium litoralis]|uniref:c-type cytochrome biogenesis protein CcsB n=1 Tax=Brevibacterium litoralis TaxID=3138935 RepID=UPI0032ED279B